MTRIYYGILWVTLFFMSSDTAGIYYKTTIMSTLLMWFLPLWFWSQVVCIAVSKIRMLPFTWCCFQRAGFTRSIIPKHWFWNSPLYWIPFSLHVITGTALWHLSGIRISPQYTLWLFLSPPMWLGSILHNKTLQKRNELFLNGQCVCYWICDTVIQDYTDTIALVTHRRNTWYDTARFQTFHTLKDIFIPQ